MLKYYGVIDEEGNIKIYIQTVQR